MEWYVRQLARSIERVVSVLGFTSRRKTVATADSSYSSETEGEEFHAHQDHPTEPTGKGSEEDAG